jgi:hypothetical protein
MGSGRLRAGRGFSGLAETGVDRSFIHFLATCRSSCASSGEARRQNRELRMNLQKGAFNTLSEEGMQCQRPCSARRLG